MCAYVCTIYTYWSLYEYIMESTWKTDIEMHNSCMNTCVHVHMYTSVYMYVLALSAKKA